MAMQVSKSLILRPSDFAPLLIEHLKRNADIKHIPARRRLGLNVGDERFCYVLLKGYCSVHRMSDDRLVASITGPTLFGLVNLHRKELDAYIKTMVPSDIIIRKMTEVNDIISARDLWEPVAKHMMVIAGKLFNYAEQLSSPSAYDIVCIQLNELFNEAPKIRESMTAENYIREKSQLSRSNIMRILAALKEGGFIEIERGVLKNIIKLPEGF